MSHWCPHPQSLSGVQGGVPGVPSLSGGSPGCVSRRGARPRGRAGSSRGPGSAAAPGCGVTPQQQQQNPNPAFFLLFGVFGFFSFSFPKKKAVGFLGIKRHLLLTPECLNLMKYPGGGIKANSLGLVPQPQRNQAGAGGHDTLYSCRESERKKLALIN